MCIFLFFLGYKTSAITLVEQFTRRSHRLQVLPSDSPPALEGHEGETMKRTTFVDARIETTSATETREYFSVYNNPLVQLPPATNTTFYFQMEGQPGTSDWTVNHPPDQTIEVEYGPDAPF